jgi:predicted nucleic acid-binding protein
VRAFTWLGHVQAGFGQWALPSTRDTAGYWARLCAQSEATGKPMAAFDSLIAATALKHGLAVVTRNVSDFAHAPVVLLNPWDIAPSAQ